MPEAWVTPTYINDPKPGKKLGNIKTNELGYIWLRPEGLSAFAKGKRVYIEYSENGDFKNFVKFPVPRSPAPAQQVAPRTMAPARPSPHQTFSAQVDTQALNIFVTGAVGRALGSGHFNAGDIDEIVREAKAAFMKHLSGAVEQPQKSVPVREEWLNDPLPTEDSYGAVNSEDIPF